MNLRISKRGNCLTLLIPAEFARTIGIGEGDFVQASFTADGGISIRLAKWDRKAFVEVLRKSHSAMPMSDFVIEELRRGARY